MITPVITDKRAARLSANFYGQPMNAATSRKRRWSNSRSSPVAGLLFGLGGGLGSLLGECFHPFELLLEAGGKFVRSVLKKHDKTKGEEHKKNEPEKPANQGHALNGNLVAFRGQLACTVSKLPVERSLETAILSEPCACLCSISAPNMPRSPIRFERRSTKSLLPSSLFLGRGSKHLRKRLRITAVRPTPSAFPPGPMRFWRS